jgi:hypothetical protein
MEGQRPSDGRKIKTLVPEKVRLGARASKIAISSHFFLMGSRARVSSTNSIRAHRRRIPKQPIEGRFGFAAMKRQHSIGSDAARDIWGVELADRRVTFDRAV